MIAQFPGTCSDCGTKIHPGDEITVVLGEWVHSRCLPEPSSTRAPYPWSPSAYAPKRSREVVVCSVCHYTKPCDCEGEK